MEIYRETLHIRCEQELDRIAKRRQRAWNLACKASDLLRDSYGAEQVLIFGSLRHGLWFTPTSDIDLAVTGVNGRDHYIAIADLQDLDADFKIDLVRLEACGDSLRESILQAGRPL